MNFWLYRKQRYSVALNKIILKNNFFFFWNYRDNESALKSFMYKLEEFNLSTIWLKRGVFSSIYLNNSNLKLRYLLKSQSFLSYGQTNEVNFYDLVKFIDNNKSKLIFLGMIINNNLFVDAKRFNLVKDTLKNYKGSMESIYRLLLQKFFVYFVLNRLAVFKFFYLLNYKKNFTLIK
tara:strand:+ start:33758 stop:34288 length:531 start_codon:yes stop_codon:yes gene_type:complete